jgi:hypothetical protein
MLPQTGHSGSCTALEEWIETNELHPAHRHSEACNDGLVVFGQFEVVTPMVIRVPHVFFVQA